MRILRGILSGVFWLLILALLIAPLWMIYHISQQEMTQYAAPKVAEYVQTAFGRAVKVQRQDVVDYVKLGGTFASHTYAYQELDYKRANQIRWVVSVGDEIREGQVLGTLDGQEILAQMGGILAEMNTYASQAYLRYRLLSPIELSLCVKKETLDFLTTHELVSDKGEKITLNYISPLRNADGTTDVRLIIDTDRFAYGQTIDDLRILTGRVLVDQLVLPAACVYQKYADADEPWYVRLVSEDGIYLGERQVEVLYSNGDVFCLSGVSEGEYCDSGYAALMMGGGSS